MNRLSILLACLAMLGVPAVQADPSFDDVMDALGPGAVSRGHGESGLIPALAEPVAPVIDAASDATLGKALVRVCYETPVGFQCIGPRLCQVTGPAGDIDWDVVVPTSYETSIGAWVSFADQTGGAFVQAVYSINGGCPQGS